MTMRGGGGSKMTMFGGGGVESRREYCPKEGDWSVEAGQIDTRTLSRRLSAANNLNAQTLLAIRSLAICCCSVYYSGESESWGGGGEKVSVLA